jgi:hypothetical protein
MFTIHPQKKHRADGDEKIYTKNSEIHQPKNYLNNSETTEIHQRKKRKIVN